MPQPSALSEIPAAFQTVAKALVGEDVDVRELWDIAKNLDASQVHLAGKADGPRPRRAKKVAEATHSNTARALVLGAAAETVGTARAVHEATKAVQSTGKIAPRALRVGEAGLQGANLGVGLIAAHELSRHAKTKALSKGILRTKLVNTTPTEAQLKTIEGAGRRGVGIVAGATAITGAALGHHLGVKRAKKVEPVAKAFRVKPLNAAQQVVRTPSLKARRIAGAPNVMAKADTAALEVAAGSLDDIAAAGQNLGGKGKKKKAVVVCKNLTWTGQISKVDEDKRLVFGWCSVSKINGHTVVDTQDDFVPLEEIEKSAYKYVIESRVGGDMHRRVGKGFFGPDRPVHTADLVESFVVTPEKLRGMGLPENALPHGWWIGMKVNDDVQWAKVKRRERTGFSIHGTGQRQEMAA